MYKSVLSLLLLAEYEAKFSMTLLPNGRKLSEPEAFRALENEVLALTEIGPAQNLKFYQIQFVNQK